MTKRYAAKLDTWVEGTPFRAGQELRGIVLTDELAEALIASGNIEELKTAQGDKVVAHADVAPSEAVMSQTTGVLPVDAKGKKIETENKVPTDPADTLTSAATSKKT